MECPKVVSIHCDELIFFTFSISKTNYIHLYLNLVNKKKSILITHVNYERLTTCRALKPRSPKLINLKSVFD